MDVDLIWNVVRTWNDDGWGYGLIHASFFVFGTIFMGLLGTAITRMADGQRIGGNMLRYLAITLAATLATGCTTYIIVMDGKVLSPEEQVIAEQVLDGNWRAEDAACDSALTFATDGSRLTVTTPGGVSIPYRLLDVEESSRTVFALSASDQQRLYRRNGNTLTEITPDARREYQECGA